MSKEPIGRSFVPYAAAVVAGYFAIDVTPTLIGAFQDGLALTESRAGLMVTLELIGLSSVSILLSRWIPMWPVRRVLVAAAIGIITTSLVAMWVNSYAVIATTRLGAGACEGLLLARTYAAISQTKAPTRMYARCLATMVSFAGVGFIVLPHIIERFSYRGAFATIAIVATASLPFLFRVPQLRTNSANAAPAYRAPGGVILCLVLAVPLAFFSDGLIWPFAERIGHHLGVTPAWIGVVLGGSFFSGLIGTYAANRIGARGRYAAPVVVAAILTALAGLLLATTASVVGFVVATFAKNITIFFLVPLLLSLAATVDSRGRVAAAASGLPLLGFGAGPYIAGRIIERLGFAASGWAGIGVIVIAIALLVVVFRHLSSSDQRASQM